MFGVEKNSSKKRNHMNTIVVKLQFSSALTKGGFGFAYVILIKFREIVDPLRHHKNTRNTNINKGHK
jgi:hypothetical protein